MWASANSSNFYVTGADFLHLFDDLVASEHRIRGICCCCVCIWRSIWFPLWFLVHAHIVVWIMSILYVLLVHLLFAPDFRVRYVSCACCHCFPLEIRSKRQYCCICCVKWLRFDTYVQFYMWASANSSIFYMTGADFLHLFDDLGVSKHRIRGICCCCVCIWKSIWFPLWFLVHAHIVVWIMSILYVLIAHLL